MKVYVVKAGFRYESDDAIEIFSQQEKAERRKKEIASEENYYDYVTIVEMEVK